MSLRFELFKSWRVCEAATTVGCGAEQLSACKLLGLCDDPDIDADVDCCPFEPDCDTELTARMGKLGAEWLTVPSILSRRFDDWCVDEDGASRVVVAVGRLDLYSFSCTANYIYKISIFRLRENKTKQKRSAKLFIRCVRDAFEAV